MAIYFAKEDSKCHILLTLKNAAKVEGVSFEQNRKGK